jgi:hypothetical protein
MSLAATFRVIRSDEKIAATEPLEVEQYWELLHDLLNQLTTTRLHTQRLLARQQSGDPPSQADWSNGVASIDRASVVAVGLIKSAVGAQVVKLPIAPRRSRR